MAKRICEKCGTTDIDHRAKWCVKCRTMECAYCGKKFVYKYGSYRLKNGCGKYCSIECMGLDKRKSLSELFWQSVEKGNPDECWEWQGSLHKNGYGLITGRVFNGLASRASWVLHYGNIPKEQYVCHKCDNRLCVNPNHVFLGTQKANAMDAQRKGRVPHGEMKKGAKLTEDDVRELRRLREKGWSYVSLGEKYGVHWGTVRHACLGTSWKHVK